MNHVCIQLKRIFATRRAQAVLFAGLVAITVLFVVLHTPWGRWLHGGPKLAHAKPPKAVSTSDITVHAELSQTKLIQGQTGTVLNVARTKSQSLLEPHDIRLRGHQASARASRSSFL